METIQRKIINPIKTGLSLKNLRCNNLDLRRYACRFHRTRDDICEGTNCDNCTFEMDVSISQAELSELFNVSDNVIANWESGKTIPSYEDLLFYSALCNLPLDKIVIFD